jgi:hypothetical protein
LISIALTTAKRGECQVRRCINRILDRDNCSLESLLDRRVLSRRAKLEVRRMLREQRQASKK